MPVKNINLLQSDVANNITNLEKDVLVQGLANLGQRMINKQSGVQYKSFSFLDCFEQLNNHNIDATKYLGYIRYFNNVNCEFGIIEKDNNIPVVLYPLCDNNASGHIIEHFDIDNDLNTIHQFNSDIQFDVQINNISNYKKNSLIKYKNGYYYTLLFGKIFGADDNYNVDYNIEIIYNKINASTNRLEYGLRLFHFMNNEYPIYCLLEIDNDKLRVYKFDVTEVENSYYNQHIIEEFNKFFKDSFYEDINDTQILRLFKNINIADVNDILENDTIFGLILDTDINGKKRYQIGSDIKLTFTNNTITLDNNDYNLFLNYEFYKDKYGITIKDRIAYINNDIIYVFPRLIQEYDSYYTSNIHKLYQQILLSILDYLICNTYEIDDLSSTNFDNEAILYVPLDLNIFYYVNSDDAFNIFNINNLFVNVFNADDYLNVSNFDNKVFNVLSFSSSNVTFNRCLSIDENIKYNSLYPDLVSNIDININYTLPYIDPLTYNWMINDSNSGISSSLNKYNNQYIFFILSGEYLGESNINGTLLNSLPNPLDSISFEPVAVNINPYSLYGNQINIEDGIEVSNLIAYAAVPHTDIHYEYLYANSIVVSIIPGSNFNDENIKDNNDLYFAALFNYDLIEHKFKIITENNDENANPIDLSYLLNYSIALERLNNSKNYVFEYLGMILNKRSLHNNYNNSNNDNIFVIYPENDITQLDTTADGNNLAINCKVINNKLDISANELLLPEGTSIDGITNNIKYLKLNYDELTDSSIVERNVELDPQKSKIFEIDEFSTTTINESTTSINATDLIENTLSSDEDTGEIVAASNELNITNTLTTLTLADYKFNINVPTLNLSEILLTHNNVLNRINILTLDKDKTTDNCYIYNTIIGSELSLDNKSTFTIRASNANLNLGTKTLINDGDRYQFRKQDKFLLEFDEIELNGHTINLNTLYNRIDTAGEFKLYTHNVSLTGQKYIDQNNQVLSLSNSNDNNIYQINELINNVSNNINIYYDVDLYFNNELYHGFNLYKYFNNMGVNLSSEYYQLYDFVSTDVNNESVQIEYYTNNDAIFIGYLSDNNHTIYIFIKDIYLTEYLTNDVFNSKLNIDLIKIIKTANNVPAKYIIRIK